MSVKTEHLDTEILSAIQDILAQHLPDADPAWLELVAKRRLYGPGINLSERVGASCDAILAQADTHSQAVATAAARDLNAANSGRPSHLQG